VLLVVVRRLPGTGIGGWGAGFPGEAAVGGAVLDGAG
jgi:hypothetical protein